MTVKLDSGTVVELTGPNACLFYATGKAYDGPIAGLPEFYATGKAYDGPIAGLPESILMELEELGAIKPC